jgi:hypothetical protein
VGRVSYMSRMYRASTGGRGRKQLVLARRKRIRKGRRGRNAGVRGC